jgi:DNA-binding response OmpR family regulator
MSKLYVLVIDKNELTAKKIEQFSHSLIQNCIIIPDGYEGLEYIVYNRPQIVIFNECAKELSPQDFIVKASQRKVFGSTTFVLSSSDKLNEMDKIKFMTLGYSHFLSSQLQERDEEILKQLILDELALFKLAA